MSRGAPCVRRGGAAGRGIPWRSRVRTITTACVVVLLLVGCANDDVQRDDDGAVVTGGVDSVFTLEIGDCLDVAPDTMGAVSEVTFVPCDQPHTQEVFGLVRHPAEAYPGASEVATFADGACLTELSRTLELTLDDGIYFSYLLPTFEGWNREQPDREVVCVLVFPQAREVDCSIVERRQAGLPIAPSAPNPCDPDAVAGGL